jgi:hypothetical protein
MKCEFCRSEVTITYPWLNPLSAQSDCVMLCANCKELANSRWATIPRCKCCNKVGPWVVCPSCDADRLKKEELKLQEVELKFNGVEKQATEALRFNEGKTPYAYVPMDLLDGAAKVMGYGAKKYKDSENFRKGYSDLLSPLSSVMRHLVEVQRAVHTKDVDNSKGHLYDKESGEAHVHHLITSVMMLIHSMRLKGFNI